jgi:flagellar L-ring protein precursor FlgH
MKRSPTAPMLAALALGAGTWPAMGQSNSMLNGPQRESGHAPATQPAGGAPEVLMPVPMVSGPREPIAGDPPPPKNPVLLMVSPIAVHAPQPRKFKVHDLITIVIREDKRSVSDAKLKSEKKWTVDSELAKWFRLNAEGHLTGQIFAEGPTPGVDFQFDSKYDTKGKVDRVDSFTARITAEIVDVKPNGNLVLEATKEIRIDDEKQLVKLTGTCRSEDVSAQNSILSTQLADARIHVHHSGAARDAARRGWIMRLFDFLRPI